MPAYTATHQPRMQHAPAEPMTREVIRRHVQDELHRLERLEHGMDTLFRIPGSDIRVGLDTILGLLPGIGDTATMLPAAYIVYCAKRLGVPRALLVRMSGNVAIDWLVGSIPVLGDLFDLGFKANRRNVKMLRRHLGRKASSNPEGPTVF